MGLLPKKFNAPVAGPMAPFFVAGLVMMYGINSAATALAQSPRFADDPRNPNKAPKKPGEK